ncbi:MAG: His-Xaa-Ser system radical SAM maturase HxsB [Elusimicrobiales bacterium]|jgi:His-Xaa-Ser system radical SAM maturase HxsB
MAFKKPAEITAPPQIYWAKLGGEYLLTNDAGEHARLAPAQFRTFLRTGAPPPESSALSALRDTGFIRSRLDFDDQTAKRRLSNAYLDRGPGLHILVLTLRCNHKCLYCQAGAAGAAASGTDMRLRSLRKSLDFALSAPGGGLTIEFQGGEPLLNWAALQEAVLYGERKARAAAKEIRFSLVSNLSLMTEEKAAFLIAHNIAVCASLDGPAGLHNKNRVFAGGDSHALTVKWLKYFQEKYGKNPDCGPAALLTVSRHSLGREREIVDEYARLGLSSIFIRPLTPIGFARPLWDRLGYTAAEFTDFYRKSLARIIAVNKKGILLKEKTAYLLLKKVLGFKDNKYVDLRSPCGAGLGQLAYNFNGDIYTCDEARMLAREGDELFRIGGVFKDDYARVISSATVKACAAASCLESQPSCARCVWKPYCGVCPVYNYRTQESLWGYLPANERCRILKGVFETVFHLLKNKKNETIFRAWLEKP